MAWTGRWLRSAARGGRCAACIALAACSAPEDDAGAPDAARPDVVVIVMDTLRPDHLGFYGYGRETASYLAGLAARGAVFLEAFSSSGWTAPATASLFTGLYPTGHGVTLGLFAHREHARRVEQEGRARLELNRIAPELTTLPERFRAAGYRTFGIGANPNIGAGFGFRRGFDSFARLPFEAAAAEDVFRRVSGWAAEIRDGGPYFLYLHLNDPHGPYRERVPWAGAPVQGRLRRAIRAYDSEIGYGDHFLQRTGALLGWDDRTLIVAISDHGEAFREHGTRDHVALTLYREVNDILMLIFAPEQGVRAQTVKENVSIVDVLPTLLDLAGLPLPEAADGLSLGPLLREEAGGHALRRELRQRPLFAHRLERTPEPRSLWAVVRGAWKLIALHEGGGLREELYDLERDPGERENLVAERPTVARALRERLAELRERGREGSVVEVEIDTSDLEALRSLGYTD